MSTSKKNPYSFLSGFVQNSEVVRVIAHIDELRAEGSTASEIMKWTKKDGWSAFDIDWIATRLVAVQRPKLSIYVTGPAGIVLVFTEDDDWEENIDESDNGPKRRGNIRDLRFIGDHIYAVGMSRQIYRREGKNLWVHRDNGVVQSRGNLDVAGFNSIDGLNELDIYAVGFCGEIWNFRDNRWNQIDSPTDLVLHYVKVISPKLVYACGQAGILLRGYGNVWEQIEHDTTDEELWGMEWFNNTLFITSENRLFKLTDKDELLALDIDLGNNWTFRHLHANDKVMWSFGPKHIAWTDGKIWNGVTP